MREGVEVGYNPTKGERSSYRIKTCFIANNGDCVNLRLDGGKSHSKTGFKEFFEDAARTDDCGSFQIFYKIMVPLSMQGVATVDVLTFVASWGEFIRSHLNGKFHYENLACRNSSFKK